jgi:hypothetical protein
MIFVEVPQHRRPRLLATRQPERASDADLPGRTRHAGASWLIHTPLRPPPRPSLAPG